MRDVVVDFLVPARLASRYRARLTALSPIEATLSLRFCPSLFRSGIIACCQAEISLIAGAAAARVRGVFQLESSVDSSAGADRDGRERPVAQARNGTTARFRFAETVSPADLELLAKACLAEVPPPAGARSVPQPEREASPIEETEPVWLHRQAG